jgi:heavy metal sensor kinase
MPVVVEVAKSEAPLRQRLRDLLLVMALALPLAVGAAALGGYVLAGRALAPLREMADQARRITADRLSERLPADPLGGELSQLATVFNETFARLERSFAQLRRFTADASHELRTPLTAIRSVGEVGLQERRDAAAYRDIIGSMLEEVDRLARLVDSLLTLSRADADRVPLHREPADLVRLAQEVVSDLGVLAEEKDQTISVEADGPVDVHVDRVILRQALLNVVDNAVKYSPPGGSIRLRVRDHPADPCIEIVDSGPGIPAADRERVFERFYRVDKARSRSLGGVGLGLAIARWAVESHGGRIELRSTPGRGCTFRVVVPRAPGRGDPGTS